MSKLLRYFEPNQCVFVTSVTANRQPLLSQNGDLLIRAAQNAQRKLRFAILAWVILPDHFHVVIDSPAGDISRIVQKVKLAFSVKWRHLSGYRGSVWQHRHWDHVIKSEEDMQRHVDYVHYNPIKHGLAASLSRWPYSLFHKYLQTGYYESDWGEKRPEWEENGFGE